MRRTAILSAALFVFACGHAPPRDVFVVIGDSIADGRCGQWYRGPSSVRVFRQDRRWVSANDPTDSETRRGSFWPLVAAQLPPNVSFVTAATGSTSLLADWQPGQPAFERMRRQVRAAGSPRVVAFLAHLGANDVIAVKRPSAEDIRRGVERLAAALYAEYRAPLVMADLGDVQTGVVHDRPAAIRSIRDGLHASWETAHVLTGPRLDDLTPDDGVHFVRDQSCRAIAERWASAIERALSFTH